jgi:DNA-directed RNA polymerase subunit F
VQASGVDMAQPEGLIELANAFNRNPQFAGIAMSLRQEANRLAQSQIKSSYELAKMGSEITRNIAQADREKAPVPLDVARQIVLNFAGKTDLTPEQQQALTNAREVLKLASPGTNVKVEMKGQENVLDIDKEDAKAYRASRESAAKALPVLARMEKLADQGIIQGSIPEARAGFLKALDTFGFSTEEARKVLGNTEQFNIQVRNLLQSIIKQFGYNPSNADVRFALESLPNASNSPEGLRQILKSLTKVNKDQLDESTRALDYFRQNKGSFAGFQPKLDIVSPVTGMKTPSQMTVEELRAEINRKKASGE